MAVSAMNLGILDAEEGRLQVGDDAFLQVIERSQQPWIFVNGSDTFESSCVVALSDDAAVLEREHPLNSYDTTYRYCRTAIKVSLDPLAQSPLLAVVRAMAALMIVRLIPILCGRPIPATDFSVTAPAGACQCCAITGFLHPTTAEGYLYINVGIVTEPFNVLVTFTAGDYARTGYVRIVPA